MAEISSRVLALAFSSVFLISPFLADIKITRPKLMFMEFALAAVFCARIVTQIATGRLEIPRTRASLPVAAYCIAAIFFYFFSPNRALSFPELKRILFFGAAFWLASDLISRGSVASDGKNRVAFLWCFAVGALWAAAYGVLQRYGGVWMLSVPKMTRVFSTFGNPIFFGVYLTMSLPVLVAVAATARFPSSLRAISAVAAALSLAALYFTGTRASWLAIAVAGALYAALSDSSARRKMEILATAAAVAAVFLYATRDVWARQQAHALIWRDTLRMWARQPVFGVGQGLFHVRFPDYASAELLAIWPQSQAIINDAHNEFLQTLAETGIAGFSFLAWLLTAFFAAALAEIRSRRKDDGVLALGIFVAVSAALVQNFFSVDMRFAVSGIYLFALMGVALSPTEKLSLEIRPTAVRAVLVALVAAFAYFTGVKIADPYLAARREAAKPDFFDERVLGAAATISELETLVERHPDNASVREKLGWVYAKEKNFAAAVENYKKAIEIAPERPGPYNNIGNIYFLTNRLDDAVKYYEKSIEVEPDQIDSRINLALAHYYRGRLGPAAAQLAEVLKREPSNSKAAIL
ncbi:MAG: tetratricopeptide repeat protein, partial [Endomicrobiia bacterium]|nr:tetratricopeptide repeat protein [Endomicrobiia bacterium]